MAVFISAVESFILMQSNFFIIYLIACGLCCKIDKEKQMLGYRPEYDHTYAPEKGLCNGFDSHSG